MRDKYRFGAEGPAGLQMWSAVYDDFDACYDAYGEAMQEAAALGADLSTYKWRGVFNLEQAALLVAGKNMYADRLYVREDV